MRWPVFLFLILPGIATAQANPIPPEPLRAGRAVEKTLEPTAAHDYRVSLSRGASVFLTVQQIGVDVVVEVRSPEGRLLDVVDSPNGRNGAERVEIIADRSGVYALRVRPYDEGEPPGRYRLVVAEWRTVAATRSLLAARARGRDSAAAWLRERAAPLALGENRSLSPLDRLAAEARILGLGEATHGSREIADLRFAVTRYLVEQHGYRMVAIEHSVSRLELLNRWALGAPIPDVLVQATIETGWIGRRTLGALVRWLRTWNAAHPADPVHLVGLDPQDNAIARGELLGFLSRVYPGEALAPFASAIGEMAAADSQTWVFGNSSVSPATLRALEEIVARLESDQPILALQVGPDTLERARWAARQLFQFADFNGGGSAPNRSRDWYMAANLLAALRAAPAGTRAVFWAHNAHVAIAPNRSPAGRTSGGFLRGAIGCGYRALASSFGQGGFVAQRPNDLEDRLEVSELPPASPETIDAVMGQVLQGRAVATWSCDPPPADLPSWLQAPQPMHWIGGLFQAGSLPSSSFRPFRLVDDFDGLFYLPTVTADQVYTDRPIIRSRP